MIEYTATGSPAGYTGRLIALLETRNGQFVIMEELYSERCFIYTRPDDISADNLEDVYFLTIDTSGKWDALTSIKKAKNTDIITPEELADMFFEPEPPTEEDLNNLIDLTS